jgi:hypothetical protein
MSLVVIAGLLVVAELAARAYAEDRVSSEIESRLPAGVEGDVDVHLGGLSVIAQYLTGTINEVSLSSDNLTVQGYPVAAQVHLSGVPVDTTKTIESAAGTVTLSETAVAGMLADRDIEGTVELGDDNLSYTTSAQIFGQNIDFTVVTRPVLDAGRIVFRGESAQIAGGAFDFDATQLLDLVAPEGLSVCVAQYLPADIALDAVDITRGKAVIDFSATDLSLDGAALARTGVCN